MRYRREMRSVADSLREDLDRRGLERTPGERVLLALELGRRDVERFVREVEKVMADIYEFPLFQSTIDALNRQIKSGISDRKLAEMAMAFREDGRLCMKQDKDDTHSDMRIICSMGLKG